MYQYTAFGLHIASEIEFPELLASGQRVEPDVTISLGLVPKTLSSEQEISPGFWITPTQYLIYLVEAGYFFAEEGNRIVVEPIPSVNLKSLRIYLLCNALPAIVHQRGFIPLHASGFITYNDGVALLVGDSGAGKSTTIRALVNRGYPIFTDDVCVMRIHNNRLEVIPSYPMLKLWEKSFGLLNMGSVKEEDRLWQEVEKYGVYFHDHFVSEWKPVSRVFILERCEEETSVTIAEQKGVEAFTALGSNTYRGWYVEPMKLNTVHFRIISKLLDQSPVWKIKRPSDVDSLSEVVKLIEQAI